MTSVQMISRIRFLLDEEGVSVGYWDDTDIYVILSEAQRQLTNLLLKIYLAKREISRDADLPDALRVLIKRVFNYAFGTTGTSTVSLLGDFLCDLHVEYDDNGSSLKPAYRITENAARQFLQNNSYLGSSSSNSQFTYWISNDNLCFGTAVSGTGAYDFTYLKKPTEITAIIDPILPDYTHEALCQYAVSECLKKDMRYQESQIYLNQFMQLAQNFF